MKYKRFKQLIIENKLFFPSYENLNDAYEMTIEDMHYQHMIEDNRKYFVISCWSLHKYEQYSLWLTYLKGNKEGVAIVTTYDDLCDSLDSNDTIITPGIVKYQNSFNSDILLRDSDKGKIRNYNRYMFYKKRYYQTDLELRLICQNFINRTFLINA